MPDRCYPAVRVKGARVVLLAGNSYGYATVQECKRHCRHCGMRQLYLKQKCSEGGRTFCQWSAWLIRVKWDTPTTDLPVWMRGSMFKVAPTQQLLPFQECDHIAPNPTCLSCTEFALLHGGPKED